MARTEPSLPRPTTMNIYKRKNYEHNKINHPWSHSRVMILYTCNRQYNIFIGGRVETFAWCPWKRPDKMKAFKKDLMSLYKDFKIISSANSTKPGHKYSTKRPFSGPAIKTISVNIEELTRQKEKILAHLCKENKCDILCIQKTNRDRHHGRPRIEGMCLVMERSHSEHGSAVFARPGILIKSTSYNNKY